MALTQDFIDDVQKRGDQYDYTSDFKIDAYIDWEDTVTNYCVAQIKEIDESEEKISLHFDGWSVKYNEDIPFNSNRLDAFRLITAGYTGMRSSAKRETWKYHYGDLETLKRKVEDTIEEEFDNLESAFEVTQFLRGELFIYWDCLLSNWDTSDLSKDEFRDIIDFMHEVYKLIIKWLEIFPVKYMKYYEVLKKVKKAFLVDKNIAIAASGYELIKILHYSLGFHDRINKSTKALNLTEEEENTDWYFHKKKDKRFRVALWYSFGSQGGFDQIVAFCNAKVEDTLEETTVPLIYANDLLEWIQAIIADFQNDEIKEGLLKEIKYIITSQFDNITDADIEKLEISQLNNLLDKLKYFGSLSDNDDKEMEEMMDLKLCHKLLKCPIFERRRQGMVNLVNIIKDLEDINNPPKYSYSKKAKKKYEWLTLDIFLTWIKDEKLIEYVFGEYSHPEIIRKSGELLQKMWQHGLFAKKEIDLVWSVFTSNFHEDIISAGLDVIEMIASDWDNEVLSEIRNRVHKIKTNDYDQPTINFIKNFILAIMKNFNDNDAPKKSGGVGGKIKRFLKL